MSSITSAHSPFNVDEQSPAQPLVLSDNAQDDGALTQAFAGAPNKDDDKSSGLIPGLYVLGSTYNVLNGKYADSKSTIQQVVNWNKSANRPQEFGGKNYTIPEVVNFSRNTTSDFRSSYGKTTSAYTKSLSVHAGFEADYPGFSASASADYSESQRENLSHAFTRVTYAVTHYNLSLPTTSSIRELLKPSFVKDLDSMDPIQLYKEYGTHLLRSLTIGGRALFLYSTDTRSYSSEMSIEAAAKISASYSVASGNVELSVKQKEAMESFNSSSETSVATKGGDPRYGNEDFLKNIEAWAASIVDYPEFVDFGSLPCFTGIWEFASTKGRRDVLEKAYTEFVKLYANNLALPGPYLKARLTKNIETDKNAYLKVDNIGYDISLGFPPNRSDGWFFITPSASVSSSGAVVVTELVPGALAPVKWQEVFVGSWFNYGVDTGMVTRFWRALPPSSDYVAMGCVGVSGAIFFNLPDQPPADLAGHFRAVHKNALTAADRDIPNTYSNGENRMIFGVDGRYWFADTQLPLKQDCFKLNPEKVTLEGDGWLERCR